MNLGASPQAAETPSQLCGTIFCPSLNAIWASVLLVSHLVSLQWPGEPYKHIASDTAKRKSQCHLAEYLSGLFRHAVLADSLRIALMRSVFCGL